MTTLSALIEIVETIIQDTSLESLIPTFLNQGQLEIAGGMDSVFGDYITPPLPKLLTIGTVNTDSIDAAYSTYAAVKTPMSAADTLVFTYNDVEMTVTLTGDYSTLQTDVNTALVAGAATAGDVVVSWSSTDLILTCAGTVASDTIVGGTYTDTDLSATVTPTDTVLVAAAAYVAMPTTFQRDLVFAAGSNNVEIDIGNSWVEFMESNPLLSRSGSIYEVIEQGDNLYYQGIPTTSETVTVHFYRKPVDMSGDDAVPDGIPASLQIPLLVNYACKELFNLIEDGIEDPQTNTRKHEALFARALKTLELSIPADTRSLTVGA